MGSLTDRTVRAAKPGRHGDGDGLFLVVADTGRRKWVLRYQMAGQRRDMGLGAFPAVGLSTARLNAAHARQKIAAGKAEVQFALLSGDEKKAYAKSLAKLS